MTLFPFDPSAYRLILAGGALIGLSLIILVGIIFLRLYQIRKERRRERRQAFWDRWFDEIINGKEPPDEHPTKSRNDFKDFLSHFIERFDTSGNNEPLQKLADALDLARILKERWGKFSFHGQLLSLTILGYRNDRTAWSLFQSGLQDDNPLTQLVSIRAMIHSHPRRALDEVFGYLRKSDLPTAQTQFLVSKQPPKRIETVLLIHLERAEPEAKIRLIPYFRSSPTARSRQWLGTELKNSNHDEILAQCLRVLGRIGTRENISDVIPLLKDDAWFVRVRAVHALGDLGLAADRVYLNMLVDPNWWVRRAAALNLVQTNKENPQLLQKYLNEIEDPYGGEQLIDIMEEKDAAWSS